MPMAADTSPDAHAFQLEAYRRMGGTARVQVMSGLIQMTRQAAKAGIRRRHPEYDDSSMRWSERCSRRATTSISST